MYFSVGLEGSGCSWTGSEISCTPVPTLLSGPVTQCQFDCLNWFNVCPFRDSLASLLLLPLFSDLIPNAIKNNFNFFIIPGMKIHKKTPLSLYYYPTRNHSLTQLQDLYTNKRRRQLSSDSRLQSLAFKNPCKHSFNAKYLTQRGATLHTFKALIVGSFVTLHTVRSEQKRYYGRWVISSGCHFPFPASPSQDGSAQQVHAALSLNGRASVTEVGWIYICWFRACSRHSSLQL